MVREEQKNPPIKTSDGDKTEGADMVIEENADAKTGPQPSSSTDAKMDVEKSGRLFNFISFRVFVSFIVYARIIDTSTCSCIAETDERIKNPVNQETSKPEASYHIGNEAMGFEYAMQYT